ncbi:hypothetical protein [uncultured Clostridium sp.]|uniref:hypothetical protein n=1 Tax=uncultured Clostridium sp. TaxID=59620 RepID=UPI0025D82659|nr:hypothetical protein [uncultured Clostridium sp.]
MKKFRRILGCIILSLIVQCGVLLYLDKVLFKTSKEVKVVNVEVPTQSFDIDLEIPSDAENIQVSYSGKFITYFKDNKLMLVNTKTSEVKEILSETKILDISWVPDNNTLFIVENKDNKINIKTYNANNEVEQDVVEVCDYTKGIEVSSYLSSSSEYISLYNGKSTKIYRIDIDKNTKKLNKNIEKIESAGASWQNEVFVYEDSENKRFYAYSNGKDKKLSLKNSDNLTILKVVENTVYMGQYSNDNKISKIVYGEVESDSNAWKTIELKEPKEVKDIYVSDNNEVFINYSSAGKIDNITKGETLTYQGEFLTINNRVICSLDNRKVCLKSVKDVSK